MIDETGKESVLANAFLDLVKDLNEENITYIQFDFHEHWFEFFFLNIKKENLNFKIILFSVISKGLNYQNVSRLTNRIENTINDMLYCW